MGFGGQIRGADTVGHCWCQPSISAARQTQPGQSLLPSKVGPLSQWVQSPTQHCLGRWVSLVRALLLGAKDSESPGSPFPWPLVLGYWRHTPGREGTWSPGDWVPQKQVAITVTGAWFSRYLLTSQELSGAPHLAPRLPYSHVGGCGVYLWTGGRGPLCRHAKQRGGPGFPTPQHGYQALPLNLTPMDSALGPSTQR